MLKEETQSLMKQFIGLILGLIILSNLNAQTAIGLKFGVQYSKFKIDWDTEGDWGELKSATDGINIGAIFNFGYSPSDLREPV